MTLSAFDSIAARKAIFHGDDGMLERYLREGAAPAPLFSITASSIGLSQQLHAGKTLILNLATGITLTLPFATGSLDAYMFYVGTTFSGNGIIKVGRTADAMVGVAVGATLAGTTGYIEGVGGGDDTLTMNGSTTGGIVGSHIAMTDITVNTWLVNARLIGSSTMVTSFTNTV